VGITGVWERLDFPSHDKVRLDQTSTGSESSHSQEAAFGEKERVCAFLVGGKGLPMLKFALVHIGTR
jgi:hypothetical protein